MFTLYTLNLLLVPINSVVLSADKARVKTVEST